MKKLFMVIPLVFLLCFTFSCQKGEELAEEPAVDVEADVEAIKAWFDQYISTVKAEMQTVLLPFMLRTQ